MISTELFDRVKSRLGLQSRLALDIGGLNTLYAAYCGLVPNDNIQKRICLAGDKSSPVIGGEPTQFFENWLAYGTGGTCFPANGALCELLRAYGFCAERMLASVMMEGIEHDRNHGTVVVRLNGTSYLVDAQVASFSALPIIAGKVTKTGDGIHDIRAVPCGDVFELQWYPGCNRTTPMVTRLDLWRGPVDHSAFLTQYALSAIRDRRRSPFNEALFIGRRSPNRIVNIGRLTRTEVSADNTVSRREISQPERAQLLRVEFGLSNEIVQMIPPDEGSQFDSTEQGVGEVARCI